jgi:hypothetical protein
MAVATTAVATTAAALAPIRALSPSRMLPRQPVPRLDPNRDGPVVIDAWKASKGSIPRLLIEKIIVPPVLPIRVYVNYRITCIAPSLCWILAT